MSASFSDSQRAFGDSQRAFKASTEGKIQAAVAKAMEPFEPTRAQDEVIKRPVMDTIKNRIKSWREHATIIGGRYLSGKSVAVEEALRGVRGVVRFTIESADWKKVMCEQEKLDNIGPFKEVMSRAREKLKDFPDNLTKYPTLLLDIPCTTTEGLSGFLLVLFSVGGVVHFASHVFCLNVFARSCWQGIDLISSTAKDMATDQIGAAVHAPQLINDIFKLFKPKNIFREG